ncbi:MAG: radical SAM protein [Deltaproteobacteria bacterium]|nr:radical SAM protein [Deltaproteobacteria bacterium]
MARSTLHIHLGGACEQRCSAVCDCAEFPSPADEHGVPLGVRAGGERLVLRGASVNAPHFARVLEAAHQAGWSDVRVRTHGGRFGTVEQALALANQGVRGVIVPLFAHVSAVHDRVAGRAGALVASLRAMRAMDAAGLAVSIEVPLLPSRLQDLPELLALAHRAVPSLAGLRVYAPVAPPPAVLAQPPWEEVRASLRRTLPLAAALGIRVQLHEYDALPLCVLGHDEEHQRAHQFNPRQPVRRRAGFQQLAPCEGCAVKAYCLGPSDAYRAAHGERDLLPFTVRPRRLFEQRTTPGREWTAEHRRAASQVINRVLRPTIHCNQDCPFCSANETTENVFKDSGEMLRSISRMARAGVKYLSFSGGEPTLSKDLVHYIRAASRLGIEDIELVTNGALIDSPEKVRPLAEAGLNKAFVSLHAHDELLSRRATSKIGDWERSVRAIGALVAAGVGVVVNHVITALNYPYLPRFADFVSATWGGRVGISFAFVTPQFKALENAALMPRISEVMPYLLRAMRLLESRGSPFTVGSRQGIPPCFVGEFTAWNDFVKMAPQAFADDEPQKTRGPQCARCRFAPQCVGLWKPYAVRYGYDELVPVPGPPLTAAEVAVIAEIEPPRRFEGVHPALRVAPRADADDAELPVPPLPPEPRRLPVLRAEAVRPVRVALLGSGPHAQRLLRAARQVRGLEVVGVASPHLLDRDPGPFAGLTLDHDAAALLDALRPDAVIVAAATLAHHPLTRLAVDRGLPVLVEKPLARTLDEAAAIVGWSERAPVMAAHVMLFTPGVRQLRAMVADGSIGPPRRVTCARRWPASAPDAPKAWSRDALYQPLYHSAYLLAAFGAGEPALVRVEARGSDRPLWLRAEFAFPDGAVGEIVLDSESAAPVDEITLVAAHRRRVSWRREGGAESIVHDTPQGDRTTSVERGSDAEGMLDAFREMVARRAPAPTPAADGLVAMRITQAVVDALAERLARPEGPKHVASPAMRAR